MKKNITLIALFILFVSLTLNAQDNNWKTDNSDSSKFIKTFYNSRLINFHTVEVCNKRTMELRISHRFGAINGGPREAWGLDGGAPFLTLGTRKFAAKFTCTAQPYNPKMSDILSLGT
jgi:hypothetical protein